MTVGILNHEEAIEPLANKLLIRHIQQNVIMTWRHTDSYVESCKSEFKKTNILNINFEKVNEYMHKDMAEWKNTVMGKYKINYRKLVNWLSTNLQNHNVDKSYLINLCVKHTKKSFVRSLTQQLSKKQPVWILRGDDCKFNEPVVLRNIAGNEQIITDRLNNNKPLWFIDSGYTNFLTGKKTWHRLVKDNLHHDVSGKTFPADRLGMFPQFPAPWRNGGNKILVVQSSEKYYQMIGTDIKDWSYQIQKTLSGLTDKPVEFRNKIGNRKTRVSVYDLLKDDLDQYYCIICHNSVAAVEAIWLGIPVITLGTHISSPVARSSVNDINDLYRGPVGDWLCALSYSQFTESEILNGTAAKIYRKFHNV